MLKHGITVITSSEYAAGIPVTAIKKKTIARADISLNIFALKTIWFPSHTLTLRSEDATIKICEVLGNTESDTDKLADTTILRILPLSPPPLFEIGNIFCCPIVVHKDATVRP
ncbi:MAG: hypothetical protein DLM72_12935 [Candidatus Nitrosopolaris wilkensis]|nr:MAG: hypothetical protein DLM72_12935 [Candidatus Nitrosopolaris wilkensis]